MRILSHESLPVDRRLSSMTATCLDVRLLGHSSSADTANMAEIIEAYVTEHHFHADESQLRKHIRT